MITFVVSEDARVTAKALSDIHLNKQILEADQMINIILNNHESPRARHPSVLSWMGTKVHDKYINGLKQYRNCMLREWIKRGKNNNRDLLVIEGTIVFPSWYSWNRLHNTHKAMLNRKDPKHYKFEVPPSYQKYGYIWPKSVDGDSIRKIRKFQYNSILSKLTADIPENLISPRYCSKIISSGINKGKECGILLKINAEYCGKHSDK
jgi:Pyrimidine dimer DNA glycosylase